MLAKNLQLRTRPSRNPFPNTCAQKLCPGKFLIRGLLDELEDDELEKAKAALKELMPLDTLVTDLWDWDIHFEDITFEDCFFDIAFGPEKLALKQAEYLQEDFLRWIDEFGMDYAQETFDGNGFEQLIYDQCVEFIQKWRSYIENTFC